MRLLERISFLCIFFIAGITLKTNATHIVGGEITYRCLGGDVYQITLKLYRDCLNGVPPYDNPTYISFYDSSGAFLGVVGIPFPGSVVLPLISVDPCLDPPNNVCVEEAVFVRNVYLPPIPGGYQLSYQRCCRNNTINNLVDPGNTGATYYTQVLDTAIVKCNSTPKYNHFPPIFICQGQPLNFDHSATDPDGDSLVYALCTSYLGADQFNPYPVPATNPPYGFVTFLPPYNVNDPLGGIPLSIDSHTGLLTGTPNTLGQFVVGICVSEYRNGVLLTTNKRDFQFNVTYCAPKNSASLPASIIECGYTIQFQNNSTGAISYDWDFGVTGITTDVSTQISPSYTYPSVGNYTVTLITNKGLICADTATAAVTIYNTITGANFSVTNICANNTASFTDLSVLSEGIPTTWDWQFNDGSAVIHTQNSSHLYSKAGTFNIFFTVYNQNGCSDTLTKPIVVYPLPIAYAGKDTLLCPETSTHLFASGGVSYLWNNTTDLSCLNCFNPIATPPLPARTYLYVVKATDVNNCIDYDTVAISVRPKIFPVVSFLADGRCIDKSVKFTATIDQFDNYCLGNIDWKWNFGDGQTATIQNPEHLYSKDGSYMISLSVSNSNIALDTIFLLPADSCLKNMFVPNAFTPNGDGENDLVFLRAINVKKINLRIYNRWGEEVYRTSSLKQGWDGTYKGLKQTPQTFVYVAEVTFWDDTEATEKGNITLIE